VLSALLPVGAVYEALIGRPSLTWLVGPVATAAVTLVVARTARRQCVGELRAWFDKNQGAKVLD
jgi:hypothetical protein